jgi:hypothetical protein
MPSTHLARLVLIEARRGPLPWLAAAGVLFAFGLAAFLSQVALTESRALQLATAAALARACAVFLIAAHVATSVLREKNDKGLELTLALPAPRAAQYLGRLAGYAVCAAAVAVALSVPLLLWAAPGTVTLWGVSLALECALVAAASLFFAVSMGQVVAAIAVTAALYLLARSIASMQGMAASPLAEASAAHDVARWSVDAVALLLPRLDAVTRTEWLLYGPPDPRVYLEALGGVLVYGTLLTAAGLFDFQRESF